MKNKISSLVKRSGITLVLAMAFTLLFLTFAPRQVKADTTYMFERSSTKVKISGKKIRMTGRPLNLSSYKRLSKKKYTYKINSKTKYRQVVNTETGKIKKLSKSKALKKLKKKNYISVYITFTKKGVIKTILFGV